MVPRARDGERPLVVETELLSPLVVKDFVNSLLDEPAGFTDVRRDAQVVGRTAEFLEQATAALAGVVESEPITPLVVRLFVQVLRRHQDDGVSIPTSIPEVFFEYTRHFATETTCSEAELMTSPSIGTRRMRKVISVRGRWHMIDEGATPKSRS